MAILSSAQFPASRRDIAAESDDRDAQHFLTLPQLALIASLVAVAWAAVLYPFLS
jgi:hypothetical protein